MVAALVVSAGACGDDGGDGDADTPSMDVSLLRTADSLETLAVQTYDKLRVSGLVTTEAVVDTLALLRDHHDEHRERLATATEDAGGERYGNPNPFAQERVVDPVLPTLVDEAGALGLAATIEAMLAETYAVAAGVFERAGSAFVDHGDRRRRGPPPRGDPAAAQGARRARPVRRHRAHGRPAGVRLIS